MPDPLLIESGPSPRKNADLIRRHAEGLAREIQHDVMAPETEVADAIEAAIRRFSGRCPSKTDRQETRGVVRRCVRHKYHDGPHVNQNGLRWRN